LFQTWGKLQWKHTKCLKLFMEMKLCLMWFKRFRNSCEDHDDDTRSGQLSMSPNPRIVAKFLKWWLETTK
jgi:hypothetical protein